MTTNTIIYHYVNAFCNSLHRNGIDPKPLLRHCGIDAPSGQVLGSRIPADNFAKLMQRTVFTLKDEYFGLVEQPLAIGSFYYASHLMLNTPNLQRSLEMGMGYYQLLSSAFTINVQIINETVHINAKLKQPSLDPDHLLAEYILIGWHRLASWLIGKNILLQQVNFDYPAPKHESEYQYMFPCARAFNQNNLSLQFSVNYLAMPIVQNQQSLEQFLQHSFHNLLLTPINDDSLNTQIKSLIEDYDDCSFPTFDIIAEQMHMTTKTLRQRLKAEGITYQKIKDALRRDSAIHFLSKQNYSIAEIATKTGFSEPSGFVRAFKNWTGTTPSQYREQSYRVKQ